jgi:hypothetical protein
MQAIDTVLAVIALEPEKRVVGRTLLQKKLYLLNELMSSGIRFQPHYYGPYSRDVAEAVDSLVSAGLIIERTESMPFETTPWGDSTRYSYSLGGDLGEKIEQFLEADYPAEYPRLKKRLAKINSCPESFDYRALSIAAKVHQILKLKGTLKIAQFPREAKRLGWRLRPKDVGKAAKFLEGLNLIKCVD